jgi:hypothetical protein
MQEKTKLTEEDFIDHSDGIEQVLELITGIENDTGGELMSSVHHTLVESSLMMAFDWITWKEESDRQYDFNEGFDYGSLGHIEICRILTTIIRQDRFVDGLFQSLYEDGVILALLGRLKEIHRPIDPDTSGIVNMVLSRGPCYGTCPVGTVVINGRGEIYYDGFAFVQPQGHHKFRIGSDQLAALEALVEKYDYFGITEKVDSLMMTDHPTVTTTVVTKDGRKRSIANYHGSDMFPKRLRRFENRIDEIVGFTL